MRMSIPDLDLWGLDKVKLPFLGGLHLIPELSRANP